MSSILSILGLYNYNKDLFKGLYLPEGVDRDVLINNLLQEASELEVLYSEPSFMQFMIGEWSKKMKPTFDKVYEISIAEYNPLYNVDAYETLTESRDLHGTNDVTTSNTSTNTNSNSGTNTVSGSDTEDGTNTNKVTGFNNDNFANSEQSINDIDREHSETTSFSDSGESTTQDAGSNNGRTSETGTITTTNRRYGNIGVTKSTELLRDAMAVTPELNIYKFIIDSFIDKFCLLIY